MSDINLYYCVKLNSIQDKFSMKLFNDVFIAILAKKSKTDDGH